MSTAILLSVPSGKIPQCGVIFASIIMIARRSSWKLSQIVLRIVCKGISTSFAVYLNEGGEPAQIYSAAVDVLEHLKSQDCPLQLPHYFESHVHAGHQKIIEYYAPTKLKNMGDVLAGYHAAWAEIEAAAPLCEMGFVHVDFHAENLMWLADDSAGSRIGVLDFQGAMNGPLAYDLANLLEDARIDIGDELRGEILSRQSAETRHWYRILATQFHCRVIGQFIKMANEDGKHGYLKYIRETLLALVQESLILTHQIL